jgi:hypothetical protein
MKEIFESGKERYIYDFEVIPFVNLSLAEECFEFKRQQLKRTPKSFNDLVLSGGAGIFERALSYILLPLDKDDQIPPYSDRQAERTLAFVKLLPASERDRAEACINDFFSRREKSELASDVLSRSYLDLNDLAEFALRMNALGSSAGNANDKTILPDSQESIPPAPSSAD